MKPKTKVTIAFLTLILVFIAAIVAIIAIFAAQTQNVVSNISISYEALGVTANVSSKYYVGAADKTGTSMTTDGTEGGETVLSFTSKMPQTQLALNPLGQIKLTAQNNFVVFEYVFVNQGPEFQAKLLFQGTAENLLVFSASSSNTPLTNFEEISTPLDSPEEFEFYAMVHESETLYAYIKLDINKIYEDARLEGTFKWDLQLDPSTELEKTFTFTENEDGTTATVTGLNSNLTPVPSTIEIPTHYKAKTVTTIAASAFNKYTQITTLYLPTTITSIGNSAFSANLVNLYYIGTLKSWCENSISGRSNILKQGSILYYKTVEGYDQVTKDLIIPDSVTRIDAYAFYYMNITSLTIGENVAEIGKYAFYCCYYLTKINYNAKSSVADSSNTSYTFASCGKNSQGLDVVFGDSVLKIPGYLFGFENSSPKIVSVVIGDNVTYIGVDAFANCEDLKSVKIGKNVATISRRTFYNCRKLNEVILDSDIVYNEITNIQGSCGALCSYLTAGTGKIKVWEEIDTGNDYLNTNFTKEGQQEEIDGKLYNVYTKN